MMCERVREALSAELDGEESRLDPRTVEWHLRRCADCRAFAAAAAELQSVLSSVGSPPVDVTSRVMARAMADRDARLLTWPVRIGLVFVGVAQLVLAVPGLLFGTDDGAPIHVAHEMGSWDLALAVAFIFVAWRPLRAIGLLPFVAVLSACLCLTAVIDLLHGRAVAVLETSHLLELVGTALLWLLARPVSRRDLVQRARLRLV